jgi:hypothetical protein
VGLEGIEVIVIGRMMRCDDAIVSLTVQFYCNIRYTECGTFHTLFLRKLVSTNTRS